MLGAVGAGRDGRQGRQGGRERVHSDVRRSCYQVPVTSVRVHRLWVGVRLAGPKLVVPISWDF